VRLRRRRAEDRPHHSARTCGSRARRAGESAGAEILVSINASPFNRNKLAERYQVMGARVKETGLPLVYVHWVGGQDELVFDGASFALDAKGRVKYQGETFRESVDIVEIDGDNVSGPMAPPLTEEETVYRALVTGVRDYVEKNRFPGVLLGLSGGIDSALVLAIVVDALGAERVHAVMMPSQYTANMSVDDSREMVKILGVKYTEIAIAPVFAAFKSQLAPSFAGRPRTRRKKTCRRASAGRCSWRFRTSSARSSSPPATRAKWRPGYATLYGDMAGGYAVIKDIVKTLVYRLARWRNTKGQVIPQRVIDRAPSAELRPDQTDQDSLPPVRSRGCRARTLHGARHDARADRGRRLRHGLGAEGGEPHPRE
jgi:NAD+ synthetase